MRRSKLTEKIKVFAPAASASGFGGRGSAGWESVGEWWAQLSRLTGSSGIELYERFGTYAIRFIIDYKHQPQEDWQIEWQGVRYRIDAIEPNRLRGIKTMICNKVND